MNCDFNGFRLIPIETFRNRDPFVTIGRSVRLSKKAFDALGNPRFVVLDFNSFERVLSIRGYPLEEGQLRPPESFRSEPALAIGTVGDSRYITGIAAFHDMLMHQLNGDNRFRLPGKMCGDSLAFHLDEAIVYMKPALAEQHP